MKDKKLVDFIKESKSKGYSDETIWNALISKGWPMNIVEESFRHAKAKPPKQRVPKNKVKNQITIFLDDELLDSLEKRAKKNMLSLPEQIEDIVRRSTINQKKKKSVYDEKLDDKLVAMFSRKNTGPKKRK